MAFSELTKDATLENNSALTDAEYISELLQAMVQKNEYSKMDYELYFNLQTVQVYIQYTVSYAQKVYY